MRKLVEITDNEILKVYDLIYYDLDDVRYDIRRGETDEGIYVNLSWDGNMSSGDISIYERKNSDYVVIKIGDDNGLNLENTLPFNIIGYLLRRGFKLRGIN